MFGRACYLLASSLAVASCTHSTTATPDAAEAFSEVPEEIRQSLTEDLHSFVLAYRNGDWETVWGFLHPESNPASEWLPEPNKHKRKYRVVGFQPLHASCAWNADGTGACLVFGCTTWAHSGRNNKAQSLLLANWSGEEWRFSGFSSLLSENHEPIDCSEGYGNPDVH